MTEMLVINEQPKDVFSDHLLGKDRPIERLKLVDAIQLLGTRPDYTDLIILVNESLLGAVKVKALAPPSRVIAVTGGAKDFSPFMTVVYGLNDYDEFSYRDAEDFRHLVYYSNGSRPEKLLRFSKAGRNQNKYQVEKERIRKKPEERNYKLQVFIRAMVFLSGHCLEWLKDWARDVSAMSFPTDFSFKRDKKISNIVVRLSNEHRGLPVFKDGDQVGFYEKHDLEPSVIGTVLQIGDGEMLVNFSAPFKRRSLERMEFFRPQPQFLNLKISCLEEKLHWFEAIDGQMRIDSPARYLANAGSGRNANENFVPHQDPVVFSKETEKILRDKSQVEALVDCLGEKYFNFIIGPAGTGKTFVTAVLGQQFKEQGKIILLLSHSNLGVDNLTLEIAKHLPPEFIFRLGNNLKAISPAARAFHNQERQEKNFFGFPDDMSRVAEKRFLKKRLEDKKSLVLACTLDSYQTIKNLQELKIVPDIVIIDEASRGAFYEFLPPVIDAKDKVIFIGDPRQLGNIAPSKELTAYLEEKVAGWSGKNVAEGLKLPKSIVDYFNRGFFNSLIELGYFKPNLLTCNRRSLVTISNLVSQVFYEGQLIPGRFNPYKEGKIIFLDTKRVPKFKEERKGTSYYNPIEGTYLVKQFMIQAVKHVKAGGEITDLVIISPYMAQVRWLKAHLRKNLLFHTALKEKVNEKNINSILDQLVITVDAIQGGQRKIVFTSLVRSNENKEIGFNNDIRRLNVALSRAQELLIIIGNSQPFLDCSYPDINAAFKEIIWYVRRKGVYKKLS